jgi:hypothetical protein
MNREHPIIELVGDLIHFLSKDQLTVEEVSARIGPVVHDPGGLMPIELRPHLPGLDAARLARYPDSGWPYVLDLELALNARPAAAALKTLLGDYQRALTDRGLPSELLFYAPTEGAHWQIVVVAQLEPAFEDLDTAAITRIAFRRDLLKPMPGLSASGPRPG